MTETPETMPEDPDFKEDVPLVNIVSDTYQDDVTTNIPMRNGQLAFVINVQGVNNLGEALDQGAINLMRWGMDSFYILATNTDTGDEYVVSNNSVIPATDENLEEISKLIDPSFTAEDFVSDKGEGEDDDEQGHGD